MNTHVSEKDMAFELTRDTSSDGTLDEDPDEEGGESDSGSEIAEGEKSETRRSIPHNTKTLDKAYGLSTHILQQFKSLTTCILIPTWLAKL